MSSNIAFSAAPSLYTMSLPFTFTNMSATSNVGPQSITYGASTPGNATAYVLTLSGGIQYWTVPYTKLWSFTVAGAGATNTTFPAAPASGVVMTDSYLLPRGSVVAILVGQSGISASGCCGGGGATYVARVNAPGVLFGALPLFIAGGAGGPGNQGTSVNSNASITVTSNAATSGGTGIAGPSGGRSGNRGDGGGGWSGNGTVNSGNVVTIIPSSFLNGGLGGAWISGGEVGGAVGSFNGGFGGGGTGSGAAGGGGGGWGGGAGADRSGSGAAAGGGSSYSINNPAGPVTSAGIFNTGMGYVTVS